MSTIDLSPLAAALRDLEAGGCYDDGSTRVFVRDASEEHEEPGARDRGPRDTTLTLTRDGRMLRVAMTIEIPPPRHREG